MTVHAASQLAKHAARVDDVAGPAYSAVASWMVPRNESPVIPTLPSDHGCLTAHSTTAAPSLATTRATVPCSSTGCWKALAAERQPYKTLTRKSAA
jgi:hypothetical protein